MMVELMIQMIGLALRIMERSSFLGGEDRKPKMG
jgi:hypothetical protein